MGINLLLDISRQSFRALDASMNVAAQNVANAETPGFHRRRIAMNAVERMPRGILGAGVSGPVGGGVSLSTYDRLRDVLLDHARWESRGSLAYAHEQDRVMSAVEALFPTGAGSLSETLDNFWNSWSDLADHPTDVGVRLSVRGQSEALVRKLNDLERGLDRLAGETNVTLEDRVGEANTLLNQIAELNVSVAHGRRSANPDLGAEDARDMKLQRLSELLPARFEEQEDGSTSVYVRGMNLVALADVMELTLDTTGATPSLTFGDTGIEFTQSTDAGEIGALMGPATTEIAAARSDLDAMAQAIVEQVNTIHRAGYGLDGATGRDYFDPTGISAGTIDLSAAIQADITAMAAGQDASATGDNANALAIHDLRYADLMNGGTQTIADFSVDIVSRIGASVASAKARALGSESTVAGLDALAAGASAVSVDDEMVSLIKLQQAYAASARLLKTADEMFTTLLSI